MRTAGIIFDIYDDPQYTVLQSDGIEKIASCEITQQESLNRLPDEAFGLLIKTASGETLRKYPRHSSDAREISGFYLEKQASVLPDGIQEKVAAAINDTSIKAVVVDVNKIASKTVKTANYGLNVNDRNYFPLDTEDQVKEASATFNIASEKLLPSERYEYAQNIIKRASAIGLAWEDLDGCDFIRGYSGTELQKVAWDQSIKLRARECLDSEKVAALKSYNPKSADSAIKYLEEWDKNASVKGVPDPYKSIFFTMEKVATKEDSILGIPEDMLKTAFDEDFISEWKKDPVGVYESLPNPVKSMIDEKFIS